MGEFSLSVDRRRPDAVGIDGGDSFLRNEKVLSRNTFVNDVTTQDFWRR